MKKLNLVLMAVFLPLGLWAQLKPEEQQMLALLDVSRVIADTKVLSEDLIENRSGAGAGSAISGSEDERILADWMAARFAAMGLQVTRQAFPVRRFTYGEVELAVAEEKIPAITFHSGGGTWGSRDGANYAYGNQEGGRRLELSLLDAGDGLRQDYERIGDVSGRAVLVRWTMWPGFLIQEATVQGAAAIVLHGYPGRNLPDALKQNTVIGRDAIPSVHISVQSAQLIKSQLAQGRSQMSLQNRVDSAAGNSENILGILRGQQYPDEWLLVAAHHDRWFTAAQDNAVGGAVMLELGRVLLNAGALRRSLILVSFGSEETGGIDAEYDWLTGSHAFIHAKPEIVGNVVYGFNIDGAGWTANAGYLYAGMELHDFQADVLRDLDLNQRVSLRNGVTDVVDAWTLGNIGGANMAYLSWFESQAIDSGTEQTYSQYYHTQLDLFRPELYTNLPHDLHAGALALSRMNAAVSVAVHLSALGQWIESELNRSSQLGESLGVSWTAALQAAKNFTLTAGGFERAGSSDNKTLLLARRTLVPWLYTQSSSGAVLRSTPYLDDSLALSQAIDAVATGELESAADYVAQIGSMGWGQRLSRDAYAAERLAAFSASDWSSDYAHIPQSVAVDVHAIYLELLQGRATEEQLIRLRAMREASNERLRQSLFLLAGHLQEAAAILAR